MPGVKDVCQWRQYELSGWLLKVRKRKSIPRLDKEQTFSITRLDKSNSKLLSLYVSRVLVSSWFAFIVGMSSEGSVSTGDCILSKWVSRWDHWCRKGAGAPLVPAEKLGRQLGQLAGNTVCYRWKEWLFKQVKKGLFTIKKSLLSRQIQISRSWVLTTLLLSAASFSCRCHALSL